VGKARIVEAVRIGQFRAFPITNQNGGTSLRDPLRGAAPRRRAYPGRYSPKLLLKQAGISGAAIRSLVPSSGQFVLLAQYPDVEGSEGTYRIVCISVEKSRRSSTSS
jgi:hypothetical protein